MKILNIHCDWLEVRFELGQADAMGWRLRDRISLRNRMYILIFVKG